MKMERDDDMIYNMQMWFNFTTKAGWVLFEEFNVENGAQFFYALLLILAMAFVTEAMTFYMWYIKFGNGEKKATIVQNMLSGVSYFILRMLNYSQMLVAMTFNFWLILFIAIAQFFAWFIFQDIKDGMVVKQALLKSHV